MTTAPVVRPESGATRPGEGVTTRRATPADAQTVHSLVLEIAEHEGDLEHVHVTPERWAALLERDDVVVLLAERAGRPVGCTSAIRRLHLWTGGDILAVDDVDLRPGERSAGVGRRLLTAMSAVADPGALTLTWGVEPGNARAPWFYGRLGATLRDEVAARWTPQAYRQLMAAEAEGER